MAAIDRMHNFNNVSCFSKESLGKNDGNVKPLSCPFILQRLSKIAPRLDGTIRKYCPRLRNKLLLCWTEREFNHVDQSEKAAEIHAAELRYGTAGHSGTDI